MIEHSADAPYSLDASGVFVPPWPVTHRGDEFNEAQLDVYAEVEQRHFWFSGRRRFLTYGVRRAVRRYLQPAPALHAIDLGAGTGEWAAHLSAALPGCFAELSVGDSSPRALELARVAVGPTIGRYQVDLRRLGWRERWDAVFLLDVLEHISDDALVMGQIADALRPGGLLFVTTPALDALRTYNDDVEHHARRYSRRDFQRLAGGCGLTLRGIGDADLARWRSAMMTFLRKLTLKHRRPLVLKSPPHTARIRVLLQMFPDAKFLHIHRHPYAVFQSMLRLLMDASLRQRLQRPRKQTFEDMVLRWYRLMYEAFFDERALIPRGHFHEIRFEELQRDLVGAMQRSYEALSLPSFGDVEGEVRRYAASIKGYRTTANQPPAPPRQERIAREWQRSFDEWGYPT